MPDRVFSYEFRGKFANLSAGLATMGKGVADFGDKLTALDKRGAQFRRGMTAVGDTAGRAGLLAAGGVGAIVLASANFEQAMSSVQAATRASADELGDLRQAALDAGASTKFSATEAAGAIENLSKAGVSTADIMGGALAGALDLAAAGGLEVAAAAEYTATAMTQFQLKGDQAAHVADLLAAGAGKAQGEVADMANALNYAGVPAANLGVSIEETAGTIALFAKNGIIGEQAGTSLRGMLASLTSPSELARKEMDRLGISVFDNQGKFVGFDGVAGQLQDRLGRLTDAERANALGKIFGNEQLQAANVLYREGAAGVETWTANVNDAGYASETAAIQMDNLKGDVEQLGGALQTALIGAGDGSGGILRDITQGATDAVNAFNDLPPAAQTSASALLGITAVTGGALWFGAKVINGIADTKQALSDLGWTSRATAGDLAKLGVKAASIVGVAIAVGQLADGIDRIDTSGLDRDLESLALRGETSEAIDKVAYSLRELTSDWNAVDLGEVITLGGLAGDSTLDKLADNVDQVDQALASMVESGNAEQAAAVFDRLMAIVTGMPDGTSFAPGFGEAGKEFDAYATAVANAGAAAEESVPANEALAGSSEAASAAAAQSADEIKAQAEAMQQARDAALGTAQQIFNLGDSVDDSKTTLRGWIRDLEDQADALRNFRRNAEEAGERGVRKGLINALEEAGPAGARRLRQLSNATDEEIGKANRAWGRGQREIQKYVDMKVPPKDLTVNANPALNAIGEVRSDLANLSDRHLTVWVTERHRDAAAASRGPGVVGQSPKKRAGGGQVLGPGGPKDDLIPARLSNREYVMPVEAVDYYGLNFMEDVRAKRLAGGGSANGKRGRQSIAVWDLDLDSLKGSLKDLERDLRFSQKALQAETKQRDQLIQERDQIRSSVASGLSADIWGPSNPWTSNSAADPTGKANAVAATAEEFADHIRSLSSKGLDGPALAEVIRDGDIVKARMMDSLPASSLASFENAINRRDTALAAAGVAATGALGVDAALASSEESVKQLKQMNRDQERAAKRLEKTIDRIADRTAKQITRGVNGAGAQGAKNKPRGGR